MPNTNLAAIQAVNGILRIKKASEADYRKVPGDGDIRFPDSEAPSTEVVARGGLTSIQGHARLGTFEVALPSLLPHHRSVKKLREARNEGSVINVEFETIQRDIGSIAAAYTVVAGALSTLVIPAAKAPAVDAIIAEGMAFKAGTVTHVVEDLTYSNTDVLTGVEVSPAFAAAAAASAITLSVPKLKVTNVAATVTTFAEGEIGSEGTFVGRVVFQLTSLFPGWIASLS